MGRLLEGCKTSCFGAKTKLDIGPLHGEQQYRAAKPACSKAHRQNACQTLMTSIATCWLISLQAGHADAEGKHHRRTGVVNLPDEKS